MSDESTSTQGQEAPQGVNETPATQTPAVPADAPQEGAQHGDDFAALPEWAQKEIRSLRGESAAQRTARQQAETKAQQDADARVQAILKAAGIETGDDGEDPVKAAATAREQAEAQARQARLELAVYRAAPTANGDAAALLDSRAFLTRVADLDPSDQDAITGAIRDAIKDTPRLAVAQAAPRSGADFTGGTGAGAITPEKFAAMTGAERNALYRSDPDTYARLAGQA